MITSEAGMVAAFFNSMYNEGGSVGVQGAIRLSPANSPVFCVILSQRTGRTRSESNTAGTQIQPFLTVLSLGTPTLSNGKKRRTAGGVL